MDLSKDIYTILTRKKYNRAKPFLEESLMALILNSVSKDKPIKLVGLWGTGPKDKPNQADEATCDFLNNLNQDIKKTYEPGIEFTFIFANSHGIHNGYVQKRIDSYIKGMIAIFARFDFKYLFLNSLWEKYNIDPKRIENELSQKPHQWWDNISFKEVFEKNAMHINKNNSPEIAARRYYVMRQLEKEMFEEEFPDYIFNTFSNSKLAEILPNIPTLYFWGTKKWHSNVPWFITSDN